MYAPVTFKDSRQEINLQKSLVNIQQFILNNNFKKLENHPYVMYLDASDYYINDKNEIYRISKFGKIYTGPHETK